MQIDLTSHIERLLFLNDTLVIPGFGGFTATRSPAAADYGGGTVTPPSKTLTFNENLTVDDGILINDVALGHGLSLDEARRAVQDFVERTQTLLNQREIVNLAGIGRLYKNYVQKIQFLPDATNFSADAYGLPPLQFSPIARSREVSEPPAAPAAPAVPAPPATTATPPPPPAYTPPVAETPPPARRRSPVLAALLGILLLLGSAAGAYWWLQKKKAAEALATDSPALRDSLTNKTTPPGEVVKENVAPPTAVEADKTEPAAAENNDAAIQEALRQKMEAAREQAAQPAGRRCILIVATLSDPTNVAKLEAKLKANNLTPYQARVGKAYQMGIEFRYTKASEIEDYKIVLQQLTGVDDIRVKQK